jgi:hypothetical protein
VSYDPKMQSATNHAEGRNQEAKSSNIKKSDEKIRAKCCLVCFSSRFQQGKGC